MMFGNGGAKNPVSVSLVLRRRSRAQELKMGRHHGRRLVRIKPSRLHWEQVVACLMLSICVLPAELCFESMGADRRNDLVYTQDAAAEQ